MEFPIVELKCGVQNYDWGVPGSRSLVAQLKKSQDPSFEIDENKTYAEMWMGCHPRMASCVVLQGILEPISRHLESRKLPNLKFLFKILSVNQALSIQVHPDKKTASELNEKYPDKYPDDNHKPEMAIAISEFQVLAGFRSIKDIKKDIQGIQPLYSLLKNIFDLNISESEKVKKIIIVFLGLNLESLKMIFGEIIENKSDNFLAGKFKELHNLYPYDVGCFFIFLMNYVEMKPGDSLCIPANTAHCYLKGDIVECMANSDNVVRLGLTSKFKDSETLLRITDFSSKKPDEFFPKTEAINFSTGNEVRKYISGFEEFNIYKIKVIKNSEFPPGLSVKSGSIIVVIDGVSHFSVSSKNYERIKIMKGGVFMLNCSLELSFEETTEDLLAFIAEPAS